MTAARKITHVDDEWRSSWVSMAARVIHDEPKAASDPVVGAEASLGTYKKSVSSDASSGICGHHPRQDSILHRGAEDVSDGGKSRDAAAQAERGKKISVLIKEFKFRCWFVRKIMVESQLH